MSNPISPAEQRQYESEIYFAVLANIGEDRAQVASDDEQFDAWYDRMVEAGHIYERPDIASLPVDQRLAAIAAEEAAEANGVVIVDDVTPSDDELQTASDAIRSKPVSERFQAYKSQRDALLKEN